MKEEKKPDAVVFDAKTQTYNASLLPYATGVGAPQIAPPDVSSWKNTQVGTQVKHIEKMTITYILMIEHLKQSFNLVNPNKI